MTQRNHLSPPIFPYPWASAWGEDRYGLWMTMTYQAIDHTFRWIEPGIFMMGSPQNEKGRYDDEDLHQVTLTQGFWMAETTVTQALWVAVMGENPSDFKDKKDEKHSHNYPVENVSWDHVQGFLKKINQLHPDLHLRLPWEAEWEYACRAGTQTPFNFKGELSLDKVNYRGTWDDYENWGEGAKQKTAEVKSHPCNHWGLYEMHGNVWEWCKDDWQAHLGTEPVQDPRVGGVGDRRVVRGGSWVNDGRDVRSAYRYRYAPDLRDYNLGFRLLLGH